jgi:hypothetical protein
MKLRVRIILSNYLGAKTLAHVQKEQIHNAGCSAAKNTIDLEAPKGRDRISSSHCQILHQAFSKHAIVTLKVSSDNTQSGRLKFEINTL